MLHLDTFRFDVRGEIGMVEVRIGTEEEWDAYAGADDQSWCVLRFANGTVRACRLTLPRSCLRVAHGVDNWLALVEAPSLAPDSPADARCAAAKRRRRGGTG